ncbi:MAG: hypothetical protein KatS3mg111_4021 [Pirellulaceae bacterium]|nr:MAG: hypothetical protein KatS3mg111_4021 [Pirellulaceae bacterium]
MFHRFTILVALAAAGALTTTVTAQAQSDVQPASTATSGQLAGYTVEYSTSAAHCPTCTGGGVASAAPYGGPPSGAFGAVWGGATADRDCNRFMHYPYVYYPQNFRGNEYYRSGDSMYYRYPPEMQIPVYNRHWHNYYPSPRRYHWGHHFLTDVF